MKNKVLEITNQNWGLMGPDDWNHTIWTIYDNCVVEIKVIYNNEEFNEEYFVKIDKKEYEDIIAKLEKSKSIEIETGGCDGDAWQYVQYKDNKIIWKKDLGYIYGIKLLEDIAQILNNLID